jgi:hypothetical protein
MSRRIVLGVFPSEQDILGATRAARESGLKILDVHTPYAIPGLGQAIGLKRSRLPWVCFVAAAIGAILKLWFEFWTATIDWPMNVGGKPWNSLPAFVPVTFEVMVLSAGLATVFAFLLISGLRPGRRAILPDPRVTDDRFVLALEEADAAFDFARVRRMFEHFHAVTVEERVESEAK